MSTSALDSVWATSDDRKKVDEDSPSTRYTADPQAKKDLLSEPSSTLPATAKTSTLDSRWATSDDTYRSERGLPATKFSQSLAQRRADLHPEESDQPLTLNDQEDRIAQDWRSNSDRTGRGYNSLGRSSYNGSVSPRQWDNNSYQRRETSQNRDRSTGLSANATPWYPDSPRRQQRQSPQPSQYEPISARPWNMIAMKKKLPSPSSDTSTDVSRTEGRKSWSASTSRSSWAEEQKSAGWTTSNRTESANADKPTANGAWNQSAPEELSIPVAPVVTYKVTTNTVSQNQSAENPVQSNSTSQLPWDTEHVNKNATTNTVDNNTSDWNANVSSTWDPSNVPWGNKPTSPESSRKTEQSTKRNAWNPSADQASKAYDAAQSYSITVSLRSQPSENRSIQVSAPPPSQPTRNQEAAHNNNPSMTMNNSPAEPMQDTWGSSKESTWDSKPEPSTAQPSNRNTWGPTESLSWQTQGRSAFEQKQATRVEPPQTSWSNSDDQSWNAPQKSHQRATTFPEKEEGRRVGGSEYELPPNASCRPWDVDKYKHRLWEQ